MDVLILWLKTDTWIKIEAQAVCDSNIITANGSAANLQAVYWHLHRLGKPIGGV